MGAINKKSNRQEAFRLFDQRLPGEEIVRRLEGRVAFSSITTYFRVYYNNLKAQDPEEARRFAETCKPVKPVQPKSFLERKPASSLHVRVGARLGQHRIMTEKVEQPGEFASRHKFANQQLLRAMEQGLHDFTLSELIRIAEIIGCEVHALLQPQTQISHGH